MSLQVPDCTQCLIGGEWTAGTAGERIPVTNPATGEVLGTVPDCHESDALRAVEAAAGASETWAERPAVERERVLLRAHDLMLQHAEDLARIITLEEGKPLAEARAEVSYGASFVRWYAAEGRRVYGDIVPSPDPEKRLLVFREPVGPTLVITPWNDPFAMVTRKVAPALAAGCPVVTKPARETPFSAAAAVRLFAEAGVPPGVINLVTTSRSGAVCDAILTHPRIRHVTFTGSTEVGKLLGARAGALVKGMTMELGGHAPFVVFEDADLDEAVTGLLARKFRNAGQTCSCPSRVFLQEGIADAFLEAFVDGMKRIVVGNGMAPGITMGPLINRAALEKVQAHVADAVAKGARVIPGGQRHGDGRGSFFAPTVLTHVRPQMLVAQDETFGPVAPFFRFRDEAELSSIVNHPTYGLTGYCYTRDLSRAFRMTAALRCGFIGLNDPAPQSAEVPMGGVRESGVGREGGRWGIEEFVTVKYVSIRV